MNHPNLSDDVNRKLKFAEKHGLMFTALDKGDVLGIETQEATYLFKAIDPKKGGFEVIGVGDLLPEPVGGLKVFLHGSNFGGSMIKLGWVAIGTRLEMYTPEWDSKTVLSYTKSISLNGTPLIDDSLSVNTDELLR